MHDFFRYLTRPALAAALTVTVGLASVPTAHAADTARQAATQKKLEAVKAHIAELAKQQQATAAQRDDLSNQLAAQAKQVAAAAGALQETDAALATGQQHLRQLQDQRGRIEARLARQRQALAQLLRAVYAMGRGSDLRLLLGDADVARIARALAYSRYFQRDRSQRIRALLGDLSRLDAVKASIDTEQQALQATRAQREQRVQALQQQREAQRALLAQADARYRDQAQRLQALQQDQAALSKLLEQLRDVFADIPGKLPSDTPFARLRGSLPWPAHGTVRASGSGLRIDAADGSSVHAVAHGRVAYANWLRGYGLLVIIDHGNGWMSLYGDNETLARGVGDWVDAGDTVGTAGATRGAKAGVYFELRHAGKPVDARPWMAAHK